MNDPDHISESLVTRPPPPTYGGVGGGVERGEDDGLLVEGERLLIPATPL
jgi:hypothetical protein